MNIPAFSFFGDGPVGAFAVAVGADACDADLPRHLALSAFGPTEGIAVGCGDHVQVAIIAEIRVVANGADLLDREVLVDKAVAVVVAVVADLFFGQDIAEAGAPLSRVADLDSIAAVADLSGFGGACVAATLKVFVGFSVAIVVEVVAYFRAGFLETFARAKASVVAEAFAGCADTGFSCFARLTDTVGTFGFFGGRFFGGDLFGGGFDRGDGFGFWALGRILRDRHIGFASEEKRSGTKANKQQ